MPTMTFTRATLDHKETIFSWLKEPHIIEFWDNSPGHKKDILIFMNGRVEPSDYADGIFTYWVGLVDDAPASMLMTSEVLHEETDLPPCWRDNLSHTGKNYSIDYMIGNPDFLGKGVGGPILDAFTHFICTVDSAIDSFIIDPAADNPRAKRVYEKAGFVTVAEFRRDFGNKKDLLHYLMVKSMKP